MGAVSHLMNIAARLLALPSRKALWPRRCPRVTATPAPCFRRALCSAGVGTASANSAMGVGPTAVRPSASYGPGPRSSLSWLKATWALPRLGGGSGLGSGCFGYGLYVEWLHHIPSPKTPHKSYRLGACVRCIKGREREFGAPNNPRRRTRKILRTLNQSRYRNAVPRVRSEALAGRALYDWVYGLRCCWCM